MNPYQKTTLTRMQETVDLVWEHENPLYRTHWAAHDVTEKPVITNYKDIFTIPAIVKTDFLGVKRPNDRLYIPHNTSRVLAATSGSTGEPFFTWRNDFGAEHQEALVKLGATAALQFWSYAPVKPLFSKTFSEIGLPTITIDPHRLIDAIAISNMYSFDTLLSTPSLAIAFAELQKDTKMRANIRFISLWGEDCSEAMLARLRSFYPNAGIANALAFVETNGSALYRLPTCDGTHQTMHVNTDRVCIDIDDQELLAFTSIHLPHATPLLRYQTGDCGEWITTPCPCGNPNPRIKLLGRSGVDYVRAYGLEFRLASIDAALADYQDNLEPVLHAEIHEIESDGKNALQLILKLVTKAGSKMSTTELQQALATRLQLLPVSQTLQVTDAIETGIMTTPEVVFIEHPGPQNKNKTVKLIQS